jgi:hypothetical protein
MIFSLVNNLFREIFHLPLDLMMMPKSFPKAKLTRTAVFVCVGILCMVMLWRSGKATNYSKLLRVLSVQESIVNQFSISTNNTTVAESLLPGGSVTVLTNSFLCDRMQLVSTKRKSLNSIGLFAHFYSLNSIHAP